MSFEEYGLKTCACLAPLCVVSEGRRTMRCRRCGGWTSMASLQRLAERRRGWKSPRSLGRAVVTDVRPPSPHVARTPSPPLGVA